LELTADDAGVKADADETAKSENAMAAMTDLINALFPYFVMRRDSAPFARCHTSQAEIGLGT
jgi:hypothetical protein